jgi:hypothetical protein
MRRSFAKLLFGALALAAPLFVANQASAAECGWLAQGQLDCELVTTGCDAECTPVKVQAECGIDCEGQCNVTIDAQCSEDCEATCTGHCTPGHIDCEGDCQTDCEGRCSTSCAGDAHETTCVTDCKSSCQTDCQAHCSVKPASCEESCHASCQGSCSAQVEGSCQVDCQGGCQSHVSGGCNVDCSKAGGALFCNGQYVTVSDLTACEAEWGISFSGHCGANGCEASVSACSVAAPGNDKPLDLAALGAIALGAGIIVTRRRRNKK